MEAVYSLRCYNFMFITIAIKAGNNKATTPQKVCLSCVCFVLLFMPLALVDLDPL